MANYTLRTTDTQTDEVLREDEIPSSSVETEFKQECYARRMGSSFYLVEVINGEGEVTRERTV